MARTALAVILSLALAACSEGAKPAPSPFDPPDGALGVRLDARVAFTLPADVDPASVEGATIAFTRRDAYGPSTFAFGKAYDPATRVLTLTPARILKRGLVHDVRVEGVTAKGLPVALGLSFTTIRNPLVLSEGEMRIEVDVDAAGWRTARRIFPPDPLAGGELWTERSAWSGGRAEEVVTAFDTQETRGWTTRYDAWGFELEREVRCSSAQPACGPDGVHHREVWLRDGQGRVVTETAVLAGPDEAWGTADDRWESPTFYDYDTRGVLIRESNASAPGADGLWRTADDEMSWAYDFGGDENVYRRPGADKRFGTADDTVSFRDVFFREADGTTPLVERRGNPGADGIWGTDDDVVTSRFTYAYDGHGALSGWVEWTWVGPDGLWGTSDDASGQRATYLADR